MDGANFDDVRPSIISAVIVLNILMNGIVIAVLFRYPQLREDRTTMFILSLTLSDLANGCTVMPISAAMCSRFTPAVRDMTPFLPKLHAMCSVWFVVTSLHSLCWVTVYKMVAITRPFRCEQILSRKRCYVVIIVLWVVGAMAGFARSTRVSYWNFDTCMHGLPSTSQNLTDTELLLMFILIFGVCVPMILMFVATATILHAITRVHRHIAAQTHSIGGAATEQNSSLTSRSIRSGKNVLVVFLAHMILIIPLTVYTTVFVMGNAEVMPSLLKFLAVWLLMSNSFVNSFLYLVVFQSVRSKTIKMLTQWCRLLGFGR